MAGRSYLGEIGSKLRGGVIRIGHRFRPRVSVQLRLTADPRVIFGVDGVSAARRSSGMPPLPAITRTDHPHLQQRRADVVDHFDRIGLAPFPAQLWRFVDSALDPLDGADDFLRAIGIDPARVKAGDSAEIDRANLVLELLFAIGTAFDRVAPKVAAALEARLSSGDYAVVRAAAGAADTFERIARLGQRWPKASRIGALESFLAEVAAGLANPLAIRPVDVATAERIADRLSRQMLAFDAAMRATWAAQYYLALRWPPHWGAAEARIRSAALAKAEAIERLLRRDRLLRQRDIDVMIQRLERANARLEGLMARISSRSGKAEPGAPPVMRPPATEFDRAMEFFGFDRDVRLDRGTLRQRFRALARTMHPDSAQPDSESQQAAHARFLALNRHYDLLKLRV